MAYAIMRCKKLKGMGSVAGALKHCFRERETFNADSSRTPDNEHGLADSTDKAMGKLREMLPEKRRKDAVLSIEYLITASPQWWETASPDQQDEFFNRSYDWLTNKYGADRVVVATVHRDETTPHLSAFVVPLTPDGRLSAKDFIGDRKRMSQDQTDFAKQVASLGLERGIEGSKAHHRTISEYYARIAMPVPETPAVVVPEPSVGDRFTVQKYGEKVAESVMEQLRPHLQTLGAKALERDQAVEERNKAVEDRGKAINDKKFYQDHSNKAYQSLGRAQADADSKAQASIRSRELELDALKESVVDEVVAEMQARHHEQQKAERVQAELRQQLALTQKELHEATQEQQRFFNILLDSSNAQILQFVERERGAREEWREANRPKKDRDIER